MDGGIEVRLTIVETPLVTGCIQTVVTRYHGTNTYKYDLETPLNYRENSPKRKKIKC